MDRRPTVTAEDIDWLRKLRNARAANQPSPDIPTSVVRKLLLACTEVKPKERSLTLKNRDELERKKESG